MSVQSFKRDPSLWYIVKIVNIAFDGSSKAVITQCNCQEFAWHELKCKHMFLISQIFQYPIQPHAWTKSAPTATIISAPPISAMSKQAIMAQNRAIHNHIGSEIRMISAAFNRLPDDSTHNDLLSIEEHILQLQQEMTSIINT